MGARVVLAPTPAAAAKLRVTSVSMALRRGSRRRGVAQEATRTVAGLRAPQLGQHGSVEHAMGRQALSYARSLTAVAENVAALEADLTAVFGAHDAQIISSFPGLGSVLGARLLAEMGDDRERFATARGLKAYAGTAPVNRASGTKTSITMRVVRNKRLNNAAYLWALP